MSHIVPIARIAVAVGIALSPVQLALADVPTAVADVYAWEVGDDNGDGFIAEDESGWDCTSMGNRRCGPVADQPEYTN